MRRRRLGVYLVVVCFVGVGACAGSASSRPAGSGATQPSTVDEFADCVFPTYPNGTYLDENGAPASAPAPQPQPPPAPQHPSGDTGLTGPAEESEVPPDVAHRAQEVAERDSLLGGLLRKGTIEEALRWPGADEQPIGIILDYSFDEPSSLPMGHGAIIDAGSVDAGRAGRYEENGLPSKVSLPESEQDRNTTRAFIFIDTKTWQVYAAQEMNTLDGPPC